MPVSPTIVPLLGFPLPMTACAPAPDEDADRSKREPQADARCCSASVVDDLQTHPARVEHRLAPTPLQQPLQVRHRETTGASVADRLRPDPRPVTRIDAVKQIGRKVDVVGNRPAAMTEIADLPLPAAVPALYRGLPGRGSRGRFGA